MNHKEWQALIPFYVAQTLNDAQRRRFEAYAQQCGASCHGEIEQWREIARVVWQDADAAARRLPPLSQEVYSRLQYRDRPPATKYSANPSRPPQGDGEKTRALRIRGQRNTRLPLTLVAGIVMTFIFGALLVVWSTRPPAEDDVATIALNTTPEGDMGEVASSQLGADAQPTQTPADITADVSATAQSRDLGVLPTPFPTNTPIVPTATISPALPTSLAPPVQSLPSQSNSGDDASTALDSVTPVPAVENGPLITPSPGAMLDGVPVCDVVNPTNAIINVWGQANRNDPPIAAVLPGERYRTIVISQEGWYQIFLPNLAQRLGWIAPENAILEGNCDASGLWLATPTQVNTPMRPSPTATYVVEAATGSPQVAVIIDPAARLRSGPSDSAQFVTLNSEPLQVGDEFLVNGFVTYYNQGWVRVGSREYPEAYLPLSDVQIIPAETTQPTPTLINNP